MAFIPTYPGIVTREIDLTGTVNDSGYSSYGAICINSSYGPVDEPQLIINENDLVETYGIPNDDTYVDFFTAASFLKYTSGLWVNRVCDDSAMNAVTGNSAVQVLNDDSYENATLTDTGAFISKYPGEIYNGIYIAACDSSVTLSSNVSPSSNTYGVWSNYFPTIPGTSEYVDRFGGSLDELHLLVIDAAGSISGVPGTILERYQYLSKCPGAKTEQGEDNFYYTVLNQKSKYLRGGVDYILNANTTAVASDTFTAAGSVEYTLDNGVSPSTSNTAMYDNGYEIFADPKTVTLSHVLCGNVSAATVQNIIQMCETRQDSVAYISPRWSDVAPGSTQTEIAESIISYKDDTIAYPSSYCFWDGNWCSMYDKYNNTNRWVPLNGHTAGAKAQSELSNEIWSNGSGAIRGVLKSIVKLAFNPKDDIMGLMYAQNINPIISDGATIVFGDKTGLQGGRGTAFSRINVRFLFNFMKKDLRNYLKYHLFNENTDFERLQIKSHLDSYLTTIKGRRGIYDFLVVCDTTNNTPDVIDANQLAVDVYLKPTRTINWIVMRMVAVSTGVDFTEAFT